MATLSAARSLADGGWLTAQRARSIAWSAFGVGMALRLVQLWLVSRLSPDSVRFSLDIGPATFLAAIVLGTASGAIGAIIVARRPTNTVGWLYVLTGLMQGIVSGGLTYAAVTLNTHPDAVGVFFAWLNGVVDYSIPFAFAALVLALFPDGRLVGPGWRIVVVLAIVGGLVRTLEVGFGEPSMLLIADSVNPYRLSGSAGSVLAASSSLGVGSLVVEAAFVLSAVSLGVRYRGASLDGRRQILWLLLAGLLAVLSTIPLIVGTLRPGSLPSGFDPLALLFGALTLAPIATLIAITRYRLYEIDRIVNRALVYGSLTAILAGVFTAAVAFAQRLFIAITGERSDAAIVLTTLVVATLYAPLRKRLEAIVDRRFKFEQMRFGAYRDEVKRILSVTEPTAATQRLANEALRELGATGVVVLDASGRVRATAGDWPVPATRIEIPGGRGPVAALLIGERVGGSGHSERDVADLRDVAGMVAAAIQPAPSRPENSEARRGPR